MTRRGQILFFVPAFLLFFVFVLLPSAQTLIDSFYSHDATQRHFVGTLYYRYAITDPRFHQSLNNNLIYLLWTLLFEVAVGLALAVGLENNSRFNHLSSSSTAPFPMTRTRTTTRTRDSRGLRRFGQILIDYKRTAPVPASNR